MGRNQIQSEKMMKYHVRYLREVREDIQDAWLWYEDQKEGLGDEFLEQVESTISRISENPLHFPIASSNRRRVIMKKFPYSIFFEVEEPDVIVIAVFHSSRNPRVWQERDGES